MVELTFLKLLKKYSLVFFIYLNENSFYYLSEIFLLEENYWKNIFKYSLIKDPSETSSLEYIKQQVKQYLSLLC